MSWRLFMAVTDTAAPAISGMHAQPDLGLPSMTRVVVAIIVTLGVVVAALVVFKRWLPDLAPRRPNTGVIKVLGRTHVTPALQAHLLEVGATRVLVVESRHGVNLTVLPAADEKATTP
jgi:flagellar biogenesis protein FliO